MTRLFSSKNRPPYLGPYPVELLARSDTNVELNDVPVMEPLRFERPDQPHSIVNAMREHQAMLDAIRSGLINSATADAPTDLHERAEHLKSFGYFADASVVGTCLLPERALLDCPFANADVDQLAQDLKTTQTKTLASGIDMIMADLKESMEAELPGIDNHTHVLVFLYENPRDILPDEPGTEWITGAYAHRAGLLAAETAVVLANYLRVLGHDARAHTVTSSDVDLNHLAVAAGLATVEDGILTHPYIGTRFGLSAVTTTFEVALDRPHLRGQSFHGRRHGSRRASRLS